MKESILGTVSAEKAGRITCGPARKGATEPCLSFVSNVHHLIHYIGVPIVLAAKLDETLRLINDAMPGPKREVINYTKAISDDKRLALDLLLTRTVDYFLTYISGLLALAYQKYPGTLGAVPVKLSEILRYSDRDEIIKAAIDEYVRGLSYQGLRQLQDDIRNKVGFRLFVDQADISFAVEAVEIRNVLVHNDGLADSRLTRSNPKYRGQEGKRVTGYDAFEMVHFLTIAVDVIDISAVEKWDLPAGKIQVPHFCHRLGSVRQSSTNSSMPEDD
jgi:hypothetical protein